MFSVIIGLGIAESLWILRWAENVGSCLSRVHEGANLDGLGGPYGPFHILQGLGRGHLGGPLDGPAADLLWAGRLYLTA